MLDRIHNYTLASDLRGWGSELAEGDWKQKKFVREGARKVL